MKTKVFFLVCMLLLAGSQGMQSQSGSLPVVDVSKNYPLEKLNLQDMASVEYVPLETTDDILLSGNAALSAVGDKYILVHEFQLGDIYLFDRHTGKLKSHFNHKGGSGMEYTWIKNGTILDEKAEEIYVCSQFIQVYSLEGKYKRTLKINCFDHDMSIFNYDDQSLLIYDDIIIEPRREKETTHTPYRFISKKDGSPMGTLDIYFPQRVPLAIAQQEGNMWRPYKFSYPSNARFGDDLMLMNVSSDTLYKLSPQKRLTPIFTRTPSVYASKLRNIWMPLLTTDKFMLFGTFVIDFNSTGGKIPKFMYDFKTGQVKRVSIIDHELNYGIRGPREWDSGSGTAIAKNMSAEFVSAPAMLEAYQKKRLKGNGNEVAKNLLEDDNQVVRILTFK
ncbi:MAG: 6-bladed beta-propeller [Faecalicoccus sp.]|uniref:6-bladed beta-propeller n=1 Tax=Faecalicoccus sp. TaxID=1971758 RepID=UPI002F93E841